MQRYQLGRAIRAARRITGEDEFVIIGSAALLGSFPDAPAELTASLEADIYPRGNPSAAEKLNERGEFSRFHETHGFWVDAVGPNTATLPSGWESRLLAIRNDNTDQATGWCLEVHDLAVSKLLAGRQKDLSFIRGLIQHGFVQEETVRERVNLVRVESERRSLARKRLKGLV